MAKQEQANADMLKSVLSLSSNNTKQVKRYFQETSQLFYIEGRK